MGFYTDFFNLINNTLSTFIGNTVANTIGAINPVVHTLLLIALGWFGWASLMGTNDLPILPLFKKMVYWSVVVSIATNTGLHSQYVVDFFWQLPDALANAIVQSTGANDSISNVGFIDELFSKFDAIANQFNQQGIMFSDFGASVGNKVFAWVIWIMGGLLTMTAAFISVVLTALNQLMPQAGGVTEQKAIELVALTGVSWFLLLQVPSMASALGGGVALSTLGVEQKAAGLAGRTAAGAAGLGGRAAGSVAKFGYNSPVGAPLRKAVGIANDKYSRLTKKYGSISKND